MSEIDTQTPGSPGFWLNRLGSQLAHKQPRLNRLHNYAIGHHPLPEHANDRTRAAYEKFQKKSRTNLPALVSEAVRELLIPVGFRTSVDDGELGDKAANRIWQANALDAESGLLMGAALNMSEAYVIVGDIDPETGEPIITVEDPRQVITAGDPIRPRSTVAALKQYRDEIEGYDFAYLYLPGADGRIEVHKAAREINALEGEVVEFQVSGWNWYGDVQTLNITRNPVVRFRNRPQMDGSTLSEFEDVLDIVDRINHLTLNRLVIATMQAFRQRALKGGENLPENDADGNPIDYDRAFTPGPDALWNLPEGVDLWESQQVDLGPILAASAADVQMLGAVSRTPAYYLTGNMEYAKAGSAALARLALESKAIDRMREFGESWEQVISLAFAFKGDEARANAVDTETIWTPPQRYSLSEKADAIAKLGDTVPFRTLMQDVYQATPSQLDRMESEKADAELFAPALNVPAASAAPVVTDGNAQA